jgi:hypothetical protein
LSWRGKKNRDQDYDKYAVLDDDDEHEETPATENSDPI